MPVLVDREAGAIARLCADLGAIAHSTDTRRLRTKSRDRFVQNPMLRDLLRGRNAEIFIAPRDKDELRSAVAACARHRVPITVRGAGSGQFGQGVPLNGGAVIDVTALAGVIGWHGVRGRRLPTTVRALTGTVVADIDAAIRPSGWELRMHPSSAQKATIGGYIAGGHAGVGSCQWGILRDTGNITALEVMTVEEHPRLIEVRGRDVNSVHHAYGANGIITEVELPVAPAWEWHELVISFPEFEQAARFSVDVCHSDGVLKKVVSPHAHPLPRYFSGLSGLVPDGESMVLVMVAVQSVTEVEDLVRANGGRIRYRCLEGKGAYGVPLYEFTWGHSLLHYQRHDENLVGLMALYPTGDLYESIVRVHREFADLGPLHVEMKRIDGGLSCQGSPVFAFQGRTHLAEVTERLQAAGLSIASPHTPVLGAGGMKPWGPKEASFKQEFDPYGLLAQGKLDDAVAGDLLLSTALPNNGWSYRLTGSDR
ncbi:FAD-binding oxidoreductase [Nocardia neocaledoniensis]|uniref:FAD-binding oxidoreductase n=1 Tax=Nocardia neocaledoniensis TaxID=236511 RepID=UPI002457D9C6|nr:FAD-binding oxidoreductase [Nocardia neocaledoniensis]